jgi:predicted metal-dependent hydrolase
MYLESLDALHQALLRLDTAAFWPEGAHASLILLGGAALYLYGMDFRRTADVDAYVSTDRSLRDRLEAAAEALGISFRAGIVMWASEDFEENALHAPWTFEHLDVRYLSPYDFVISKLARWHAQDQEDARVVAVTVDLPTLRDKVRQALPVYIGPEERVRFNWKELCTALNRPDLAQL